MHILYAAAKHERQTHTHFFFNMQTSHHFCFFFGSFNAFGDLLAHVNMKYSTQRNTHTKNRPHSEINFYIF